MTRPIEFAKLSGSGNDFICIDNCDGRYDALIAAPKDVERFAQTLCRRGLGVGADGVIFACTVDPGLREHADIAARLFEADGTEAELCGNGTACFVHWVLANRMVQKDQVDILTPAGVVIGRDADAVYTRVCIPIPRDLQRDVHLRLAGTPWTCDYVVVGVPHVTTFVEDIDTVDVARWGPLLRHHERFAPRGVNANFAQVLGEGELAIRTWEFGVEGETLACGTGSTACAILAALRNGWGREFATGERPIRVRARSGDVLRVYFARTDDGTFTDLCLETVTRCMYVGTVCEELACNAMGTAAC